MRIKVLLDVQCKFDTEQKSSGRSIHFPKTWLFHLFILHRYRTLHEMLTARTRFSITNSDVPIRFKEPNTFQARPATGNVIVKLWYLIDHTTGRDVPCKRAGPGGISVHTNPSSGLLHFTIVRSTHRPIALTLPLSLYSYANSFPLI